jgi:hypothetical protein
MFRFWKAGALLLLGVSISLAGVGVVVAGVLGVAIEIFGGEAEKALFWTISSLPLWGPVALGYLLQALPRSLLTEVWS